MIRKFAGLVGSILIIAATAANAQTFFNDLLSPSRLPWLLSSRLIQISSTDTSGGNNDFISVPAGATATLADIQGPGLIVQLWVTIDSPDKYFLRHILLKMYWDDEANPSVEVPIGDFFGTGFQYKQWLSLLVGMSSGGYYSYLPMPFNKRARVEIVNETGAPINSFYYHIDYQKLKSPLDTSVGYFHAMWRREPRTDPHHAYLILDATGRGQFVGMNLNMQSYDGGLSFLEGDEMIFVDGEATPSLRGTGTEDYFNSGWYFNQGAFSAPYHGLIIKDDSLGRIAAYRFHVLDAIPFETSIRVTIEHGDRNREIADYSSTAYWYQKEPHKPFPPILPAPLRTPLRVQVPNGALEAESLPADAVSGKGMVEDMTAYGADWGGGKQRRFQESVPGAAVGIRLRGPELRYTVGVYYTKGPSYGEVRVISDRKTVGKIHGYNPSVVPGGCLVLHDVESRNGTISLNFLVEGKQAAATGYDLGLDAFTIEPVREFIRRWDLIGPFPNPRDQALVRHGLDIVYPPETEFSPHKVYGGAEGEKVQWHPVAASSSGYVNLQTLAPSDLVVAYAHTRIYSPREREATLLLGSDDGVKVFLNGKEIHRNLTIRVAEADQDTVSLPLEKGWNALLLKIENNFGGFGFYARVIDPARTLVFRPSM